MTVTPILKLIVKNKTFKKVSSHFLVADTQLYKRLCPSVRWLVGRSVDTSRKVRKRAFPPRFLVCFGHLCHFKFAGLGLLV